jgi:hypothetical protein
MGPRVCIGRRFSEMEMILTDLINLILKLSLKEEKPSKEPEIKKPLFESFDIKGVAEYIKTKKPKNILGKKNINSNSDDWSRYQRGCRNS